MEEAIAGHGDLTLPIDYIRRIFSYDENTGALSWRERPINDFPSESSWKTWNTKFSYKTVGCVDKKSGYVLTKIKNINFKVHRIIYAWQYGEWPEDITHINGNNADNRIENLLVKSKRIAELEAEQKAARELWRKIRNICGVTRYEGKTCINYFEISEELADNMDKALGMLDTLTE